MLKNVLKSVTKDKDGETIPEQNNIRLAWDGKECVVAPGKTVDVRDHFDVTNADYKILEGRFTEKFNGAIVFFDGDKAVKAAEAERVKKVKAQIDKAKSFSEVKEIIMNDENKEIVEYALAKVEAAQKPNAKAATKK